MPDPTSSDYTIRLPIYEGPLGLLLYLIKKSEIDIYDIPITEIARQYQEHLSLMRDLNLEVAGEFFVMAATLIQIKSRMLLPRQEKADGTLEDPREELVNQLLEFQRIQEAARALHIRQEESARLFPRSSSSLEDLPMDGAPLLELDLFALVAAFHAIIQAERWRRPLAVAAERFTVEQKIAEIESLLRNAGTVVFSALFAGMSCREEMIAAFLALLELVKIRKLRCVQAEPCGPIQVQLREPEEAPPGSDPGAGREVPGDSSLLQ